MRRNTDWYIKEKPPYEVLGTSWLSYGEIAQLKKIEEMVEVYYNSGQFANTLHFLVKEFASPFRMYEKLSGYYEEKDCLAGATQEPQDTRFCLTLSGKT